MQCSSSRHSRSCAYSHKYADSVHIGLSTGSTTGHARRDALRGLDPARFVSTVTVLGIAHTRRGALCGLKL